MRLTIIGCGYVGLVAGACFAEAGHDVTCVDVDERRIEMLRAGRAPFFEPGLEALLRSPRLTFSSTVVPADVVFIAVGTPDGDAAPVLNAAREALRVLSPPGLLVIKSTVPVGTAAQVQALAANVDVVSNPEFLREGSAVDDFRNPSRVIVGTDSQRARAVLSGLYAGSPLLFMDTRSAELTKLASNAMLATRISFMNELARLAAHLGAGIDHVREGVGSDPRIGSGFLRAGIGYGGSCLPRDVRALADSDLLRVVDAINERQKTLLVDAALRHFGGSLRGRTFAVWGLAFKPGTDDVRESPAIALVEHLRAEGATVRAFDPVVKSAFATALDTLDGADALFLATEWPEFVDVDFAEVKALLSSPVVFDGRNALPHAELKSLGFTYFGVGR